MPIPRRTFNKLRDRVFQANLHADVTGKIALELSDQDRLSMFRSLLDGSPLTDWLTLGEAHTFLDGWVAAVNTVAAARIMLPQQKAIAGYQRKTARETVAAHYR